MSVTDDFYAEVQALAAASGCGLGEYVRAVLERAMRERWILGQKQWLAVEEKRGRPPRQNQSQ